MGKAACLGWLQGKQCQRYGKGSLVSDDYSVNKRCTETTNPHSAFQRSGDLSIMKLLCSQNLSLRSQLISKLKESLAAGE